MLILSSFYCALALTGPATLGQSQVTLKFYPPIGKSYHYKMSMNMSMSGMAGQPPMSFKTDSTITMKSVSRTGDMTTMESTIGEPNVTVGAGSPPGVSKEMIEGPLKAMVGKPIRTKIDSHYNVQSVGAGAGQMFGGMPMKFPNHPIRVGESWTSNLDLGKAVGGMLGGAGMSGSIPMKFTLISITKGSRGQSIANIALVMKGDTKMNTMGQDIAMRIDSNGTMAIDTSSGITVSSSTVSVSHVSSKALTMTQNMTQKMTLQ